MKINWRKLGWRVLQLALILYIVLALWWGIIGIVGYLDWNYSGTIVGVGLVALAFGMTVGVYGIGAVNDIINEGD